MKAVFKELEEWTQEECDVCGNELVDPFQLTLDSESYIICDSCEGVLKWGFKRVGIEVETNYLSKPEPPRPHFFTTGLPPVQPAGKAWEI